jgi:hypothetical protein
VVLVFLIAQVPLSLAGWVAVGEAPSSSGLYSVIIRARYGDAAGTSRPLTLWVAEFVDNPEGLEITPLFQRDRTPPIKLEYQITLNGSRDFELLGSEVAILFTYASDIIQSTAPPLRQTNETYTTTADVPFEGDYEALVTISLLKEGTIYNGTFASQFRSDEPSPDLRLNAYLRDHIFKKGETFTVYANMSFRGEELQGANILRANLFGTTADLVWDSDGHVYDADMTAPKEEGIYELQVYAFRQGYLKTERVYVADTGKQKAARCPITSSDPSCDDLTEVRRCAVVYKEGTAPFTEAQIIQCFESAWGGITRESFICDPSYIGDLDGDYKLDDDDLDILKNQILPLDVNKRIEYVGCADYDRDGDVDDDDMECMTKVEAKEWWGDFKGGICFDVAVGSPIAGDLNGDDFLTGNDTFILERLVAVGDMGIGIPQEMLDVADFDQDGSLTESDTECLSKFIGLDMSEPYEGMTALSGRIPAECMAIYHLDDCKDVKGDINGDLKIDQTDKALIILAKSGSISGVDYGCADLNSDNRLTDEDVLCLIAYVDGDTDEFYGGNCLNCEENMPSEYRFEFEVCNDGFDNNCDGLIDRTSEEAGGDICVCSERTPCYIVSDADGGVNPGISDGNIQVCRDTSGAVGASGYKWIPIGQLVCDKEKACQQYKCAGEKMICSTNGKTVDWYPEDELPEETDDPKAQPKTCDDGWDNDCSDGDVKCKEEEETSVWEQVLAGLVGAVVAWWGGPILGTILCLAGGLAFEEYSTAISIGCLAGSLFGVATKTGAYSKDLAKELAAGEGGWLDKLRAPFTEGGLFKPLGEGATVFTPEQVGATGTPPGMTPAGTAEKIIEGVPVPKGGVAEMPGVTPITDSPITVTDIPTPELTEYIVNEPPISLVQNSWGSESSVFIDLFNQPGVDYTGATANLA